MSYEKIFEYDLDITGVTDYGADMEALLMGRDSAPLQGAQFDVTLAGSVKGRVDGRHARRRLSAGAPGRPPGTRAPRDDRNR